MVVMDYNGLGWNIDVYCVMYFNFYVELFFN